MVVKCKGILQNALDTGLGVIVRCLKIPTMLGVVSPPETNSQANPNVETNLLLYSFQPSSIFQVQTVSFVGEEG